MSKFKIGDRVRRVRCDNGEFAIGDTGTVVRTTYDGDCNVKLDKTGSVMFCISECLEPVPTATAWQPKVGDRVRFIRDSTAGGREYGACGDTATVTMIGRKEGVDVKLDVDRYRIGFNPSAYVRDLEPLPVAVVAEQAQPAAWVPSVGDRVVCVKDYHGSFTAGKEYVVRYFEPKEPRIGVVENDLGDPDGIGAHYFGPIVKPFKIEAGKLYKTRDGRKIGPMVASPAYIDRQYPFTVKHNVDNLRCGKAWREDGSFSVDLDKKDKLDLIAEWVDEPAVASVAVANDNATKPKFKVGDRVKFRDDYGSSARGKEATVINVSTWGIQVDLGGTFGVSTENPCDLVLLSSTATQPTAIVALIEDGQPKPASRPFVHHSVESATKEAERLAGVHKGQEFGVYVLQSSAKQEKPVMTYKHEWQRLAAKGEKINAIKELRGITGLGLKATKDAVEYWLANDEPRARIAA